MAKKRKQTPFFKKLVFVGLVLIVVQIALFVYFRSQNQGQEIMESVDSALSERGGLGSRRREQTRVQLAVLDFQRKNKRLPNNLEELKGAYFETVPIDPGTGQPFEYKVTGNKFTVGQPDTGEDVKTSQPGEAAADVSLTPTAEELNFVYDPAGKRDPFRPFEVSRRVTDQNATPLERYDIGQFKLTAVLSDPVDPSATVELADGKGYILRKGTKIGVNNGVVIDIQQNKVLVLETYTDFTGQTTTKTVEMQLRTKDQEEARTGGR